MDPITNKRLFEIAQKINPIIEIHEDGCKAIKELLNSWNQLFLQTTDYLQLCSYINNHLPSELTKSIHEYFQKLIEFELEEVTNIIPLELFNQIKILAIELLSVAILEVIVELSLDRGIRKLDSYDIYTGIQNHKLLNDIFGKQIPIFPYVDDLKVSEILKSIPNIKYTKGFVHGLEGYLGTIINLISKQDISIIDNFSLRFGEIIVSDSKLMAIRQLKTNIVNYAIHQSINIENKEYCFTDVIQSLKFLQRSNS